MYGKVSPGTNLRRSSFLSSAHIHLNSSILLPYNMQLRYLGSALRQLAEAREVLRQLSGLLHAVLNQLGDPKLRPFKPWLPSSKRTFSQATASEQGQYPYSLNPDPKHPEEAKAENLGGKQQGETKRWESYVVAEKPSTPQRLINMCMHVCTYVGGIYIYTYASSGH